MLRLQKQDWISAIWKDIERWNFPAVSNMNIKIIANFYHKVLIVLYLL